MLSPLFFYRIFYYFSFSLIFDLFIACDFQSRIEFSQHLICFIGKSVYFSNFNDWFRINFNNLISSLHHADCKSSFKRTTDANDKRELSILDFLTITLSILLVKEENMRTNIAIANRTFCDFVFEIIRLKVVIITSHKFAIPVYVVILIFFFLRFQMQVIDILCSNNNTFTFLM